MRKTLFFSLFLLSGQVFAAELLVKAIDYTHADNTKDARGSYKRGDVVVVMPDGHIWGKAEGLPKFYVVKIPDLSVAAAKKYIQPHKELVSQAGNWNKLYYDETVISSNYYPYESQPSITKTTNTETVVEVSNAQWDGMVSDANYDPYYSKPAITDTFITTLIDNSMGTTGYELTGDIRTVDLQGDVEVIKTRRAYEVVIDEAPNDFKTSLGNTGIAIISWTELHDNMENKETGIGEAAP